MVIVLGMVTIKIKNSTVFQIGQRETIDGGVIQGSITALLYVLGIHGLLSFNIQDTTKH